MVDKLHELNAEQRRAVEAVDGPLVVVAGPGTGKTKTLTTRIAHLVASGKARPEQILALTFTKKAAEEMRSRVAALVSGSVPHISTFHALCHELLGGDTPFANEPQRLQIIKNLRRPAVFKQLSVREMGLIISRAKNLPEITDPETSALVEAYNLELGEQGLRDFDDLLLETYRLLSSDQAVREKVQQRYRYVLVDEFQDTNRLQYELLKLLLGHDNVCVIGDPNQSIYGFRGASGTIFEQFKADFPSSTETNLTVNYRSAPEIVNLSNAIFAAQTPLTAFTTQSGRVRTVEVLNEYTEANWVLDEIQRAIGGGDFTRAVSDDDRTAHRSLRDFAVLYRSRSAAAAVQKTFAQSGLPYQIVGDGSPYERSPVQEIINLLTALETDEDVEIKNATKTQCRTLLTRIDKTQPPADMAEEIIRLFSFEAGPDVAQLTSLLLRFDQLRPALDYLARIAEGQFYDPRADAITLLTIHAAKGLEFPYVFLVGAEDGVIPGGRGDMDEERRLFYVAATRARERLEITYAKKRGGQPAQISPFVADLPSNVLPREKDPGMSTQTRRIIKRQAKRSQQSLF